MADHPSEDVARHRDRLEILDALVAALSRRGEVFDLVGTASDPDDARAALTRLLGIGPGPAAAIADLQLHRFTERERERVTVERDALRHALHGRQA